ncbi:MAG TPA: DEAD/DEAH box helicase [Pyrinomonadaceae bacterium]|nr:DEAD/DEAH box helicase [Pyrinomonadaceae bacterium]
MKTRAEGSRDTFRQFGLSEPLLQAIGSIGYESPTPTQIKTIPPLLAGRDVVGQAQTGTGKLVGGRESDRRYREKEPVLC